MATRKKPPIQTRRTSKFFAAVDAVAKAKRSKPGSFKPFECWALIVTYNGKPCVTGGGTHRTKTQARDHWKCCVPSSRPRIVKLREVG